MVVAGGAEWQVVMQAAPLERKRDPHGLARQPISGACRPEPRQARRTGKRLDPVGSDETLRERAAFAVRHGRRRGRRIW